MTRGLVKIENQTVGYVWQDENGYWFEYTDEYFGKPTYGSVSQTLPVTKKTFNDKKGMIPFFDGLIPEGWLLDIALDNWKINEKDRMELLLTVCKDCVGAVSIVKE